MSPRTPLNERLKLLINQLKKEGIIYNDSDFAQKIGISKSFLSDMKSGSKSISERTILNIESNIPQVNKAWLLTGEGEMFKYTKNQYSNNSKTDFNKYIEDFILMANNAISMAQSTIKSCEKQIDEQREIIKELREENKKLRYRR